MKKPQPNTILPQRSSCKTQKEPPLSRKISAKSKFVGKVLPSDQAFIDVLVEQRDSNDTADASNFRIENIRRSMHENGLLRVINEHQLAYRDETIYYLSTTSHCNGVEMWGQKSACSIRNGCLRITISDRSPCTNSNHCIHREAAVNRNIVQNTLMMPLKEILSRSAVARQDQILYTTGSPRSVAYI